MRERKTLTPKEIIEKDHYRSIIYLIDLYKHKKIRFIHLRYALVEQHGIPLSDKTKQKMYDFFEGELNDILFHEWFDKKIIGKRGINNLTNFLNRLIKMKMIIKKKKDSDRFPYYYVTKLGESIFKRWFAHYYIDILIPDEGLTHLLRSIGEITAKIGIRADLI